MTGQNDKGKIFITCEHGGNSVPNEYRDLFLNAADVLSSHRGFDIGALNLSMSVAAALSSSLYYSETTRLLVDLNRSEKSKTLFSEFTSHLPEPEKRKILKEHYFPYRKKVEGEITRLAAEKRLIHIAFHSFTPVLNGVTRKTEIGLLYDPRRSAEKSFCSSWKKTLKEALPDFRIRMNYPYKGISDCLPASMKKILNENQYSGIELEINQALFSDTAIVRKIEAAIIETLSILSC